MPWESFAAFCIAAVLVLLSVFIERIDKWVTRLLTRHTCKDTALTIIRQLEQEFKLPFLQFYSSETETEYGVADTNGLTPIQIQICKDDVLAIYLDRSLLHPFLLCDIDLPHDFAAFQVDGMLNTVGQTESSLYFTFTPEEFAAEPECYMTVLRFTLQLYLFENKQEDPFNAVLNSF
jgi:hypothetical protein